MFQAACLKLPKSIHPERNINLFFLKNLGFFSAFGAQPDVPPKVYVPLGGFGISWAVLPLQLCWHAVDFQAPGCTGGSNPGMRDGCSGVEGVVGPGSGDFKYVCHATSASLWIPTVC